LRCLLAPPDCSFEPNADLQQLSGGMLKIKNILSAIFSHGVRGEFVERNPVYAQGGTPRPSGASTGVR
jgi:hypothetical protein